MKYLLSLVLCAMLTACASSGQESGQGSIDQNVRGGLFSSYTGQHGGGKAGLTNVTRTVIKEDGTRTIEKIEITSNAPFVMMFDEATVEANTDVGTTGATADTNAATNSTSTEADATVPLNGPK